MPESAASHDVERIEPSVAAAERDILGFVGACNRFIPRGSSEARDMVGVSPASQKELFSLYFDSIARLDPGYFGNKEGACGVARTQTCEVLAGAVGVLNDKSPQSGALGLVRELLRIPDGEECRPEVVDLEWFFGDPVGYREAVDSISSPAEAEPTDRGWQLFRGAVDVVPNGRVKRADPTLVQELRTAVDDNNSSPVEERGGPDNGAIGSLGQALLAAQAAESRGEKGGGRRDRKKGRPGK